MNSIDKFTRTKRLIFILIEMGGNQYYSYLNSNLPTYIQLLERMKFEPPFSNTYYTHKEYAEKQAVIGM
jgi:hypothetical protein